MGRKEFYEKLEDLNQIRKNVLFGHRPNNTPESNKQKIKIDKEISQLKLLLQNK
jgi:hypothetical protein